MTPCNGVSLRELTSLTVPAPSSSVNVSAAIASSIEPGAAPAEPWPWPTPAATMTAVVPSSAASFGIGAELEQRTHVRQVQRLRREQERRRAARRACARLPRVDVGAARRELADELEARELVAMLGPRQVEPARPTAHATRSDAAPSNRPRRRSGPRRGRAARPRPRSSGFSAASTSMLVPSGNVALASAPASSKAFAASTAPARTANASAVNSPVASRASRSAPAVDQRRDRRRRCSRLPPA